MKKAKLGPMPNVAGLTTDSMDQKMWQAKDDANVLKQAGEVMGDRTRHAAARQMLNKHMKAIQTIQAVGKNGAGKTPSLGFGKKRGN